MENVNFNHLMKNGKSRAVNSKVIKECSVKFPCLLYCNYPRFCNKTLPLRKYDYLWVKYKNIVFQIFNLKS